MSSTPPHEPALAARLAGFPRARQGYSRGHVDALVADAQRYVEQLRAENAALAAEVRQLTDRLSDTEAKYERIRTADLDERAQDILAAADEQARRIVADGKRVAAENVQQARQEAEVVFERGRQELAWQRRRLAAERVEAERQLQASRTVQESARPVDSAASESGEGATPDPEPQPGTATEELARQAQAAAAQQPA